MKRTALALIFLLAACSSKIQHGLDEGDANEIETVLQDNGISSTKELGTGRDAKWEISVPQAQASSALRILREHDLPHAAAAGFSSVYGQGSMVPTANEERAMFIRALSGEVSRLLEGLDGVVRAQVIVIPEAQNPNHFGPSAPARASVVLNVLPKQLDALVARKGELAEIVAGGVPGLAADHVAILFDAVRAQPPPLIVQHKDRTAAALVGIVAGLLIALLAGALVWATLRTRKMRLLLDARPALPDQPRSAVIPAPRKVA